jgi:hypothetical protein
VIEVETGIEIEVGTAIEIEVETEAETAIETKVEIAIQGEDSEIAIDPATEIVEEETAKKVIVNEDHPPHPDPPQVLDQRRPDPNPL